MTYISSTLKSSVAAFGLFFLLGVVAPISAAVGPGSFQQFIETSRGNFGLYKSEQLEQFEKTKQEFSIYLEQVSKEISAYKKTLERYWRNPELTSKTKWIEYGPDYKTKSEVNFEKNIITVEVIASSKSEAEEKIKETLERVVTLDTQSYHETNELERNLKKIQPPKQVVSTSIQSEPILADVIFNVAPTPKTINEYIESVVGAEEIEKRPSKLEGEATYQMQVQLPPDTAVKKARKYLNKVRFEADKNKLPVSVMLAIIQTESYFNPLARSPVPAFGLMQIVPKTAGVDAYHYLFGEKKIVDSSYLYDSNNNIQMGVAYFHILYYQYFSKVENLKSRMYCAIAAYNTGLGNVSWVFNQGRGYRYPYSVSNAVPIINRMSPSQVYHQLVNNLKYEEARSYLEKVNARSDFYSNWILQEELS